MNKSQEKAIRAASAEWTVQYLQDKLLSITQRVDVRAVTRVQLNADTLVQIDQNIPELKKDKLIHTILDNQSKVIYVKRIITSNTTLQDSFPELYQKICEEIKEIENDYKWCNSKRGKSIIAIENWIDMAREQQPPEIRQLGLILGRNNEDTDPCNIVIGGCIGDAQPNDIEGFFNALQPPVRPFFLFKGEKVR